MPKSKSRQKSTRRSYVPAPGQKKRRSSPSWYGFLVIGLMVVGVALIVLNYMDIMPGGTRQLWLWTGLGFIAGGFAAATQWR
jgi:hypothetical protein